MFNGASGASLARRHGRGSSYASRHAGCRPIQHDPRDMRSTIFIHSALQYLDPTFSAKYSSLPTRLVSTALAKQTCLYNGSGLIMISERSRASFFCEKSFGLRLRSGCSVGVLPRCLLLWKENLEDTKTRAPSCFQNSESEIAPPSRT